MTSLRNGDQQVCYACRRMATEVYQMVTVPGNNGRIPMCCEHAETFRAFAGTLTIPDADGRLA